MISPAGWTERDPTTLAMTLLWGLFTVAYFVFFYIFQDAAEIADASLDGYLEVILLGVPTVVLLGGIMWLGETDADRDLRPRMLVLTVGMGLFFVVAMYTALFVIETRFDRGEQWLILLMSAGFGASAGTVMGALGIRSKQRERERNESLRRARKKERQRSQLEHLNHYLRHEMLNKAQKINGFASILADNEAVVGDDAKYVQTIRESSAEIAEFVESIRTILDATEHEPQLEPIDVVSVVETEVEKIRRTHPAVDVEVIGLESVKVLAGGLLGRVFRNLFENAIEHNGDSVSITVLVESNGEWTTVRIRDDGFGIPAGERDDLFTPPGSGDHGYGLYLTKNLAELYGGWIELAETGPGGTEFVARFQSARAVGQTEHVRKTMSP